MSEIAPRRRFLRLPVPHSAVPGWFAVAALGLAAVAATALVARPVGLGVTALAVGLCLAVARVGPARDGFSTACWVAATALAGVATLRAAGWVAALCLLAATALASLAASGAASWREVGRGLVAVVRHLVPGPLLVAGLVAARMGGTAWSRLVPAARGAVLALGLLVVFGALFAAADAAFAAGLERLLSFDELSHPWGRAATFVLVLALAGALLAARCASPRGSQAGVAPATDLREAARAREASPATRRRRGRTEWLIALVALDGLFAAFVALQLATLFGGDELIARTAGLTYAEYAREGFGQLVAVAVLTLGVVAAAARPDRSVRALLGVLCVLCLVVLASALARLGLYEAAYGFTRLRVFVHATILWLGALLLLVLLAGAMPRVVAWLPRSVVALTAVAALAFGLADPDRRIAQANVERFERSGKLDLPYLARLSADATPALVDLPPRLARCAVTLTRRELSDSDGLAGLNLGRVRARRALASVPRGGCSDRA